jgi:membrane dipeptidase
MWKQSKDNDCSFFESNQKEKNLFMLDDSPLDASYYSLKHSNALLQNFAIYVPDYIPLTGKLGVALRQIDLFYQCIEPYVPLFQNTNKKKLAEDKIYSVLSLEGGEALGNDLSIIRLLYRLGVRQLGLTWNCANALSDGCKERRNGGLTNFGRECVKEMVRLGMIVDVSHLSQQGFWDVVSIPNVRVMASHSNCLKYCNHPRNLNDDQIKAIINLNGLIGITYVPQFVIKPYQKATPEHLIYHIDHIRNLGGENHIAFGSDFDGMVNKLTGLSNPSDIPAFYETLISNFPRELVNKWSYLNAYYFYKNSIT